LGIVCMASNKGLIIVENFLLNDIYTPNGIPTNNEINTAVVIIAIVIIMSSHKPNVPIKNTNILYKIPEKNERKNQPNKKIMITNTNHGIQVKNPSMPLIILDATKKIKLKNPSSTLSKKSTRSFAKIPILNSILGKFHICRLLKCSFTLLYVIQLQEVADFLISYFLILLN